MSKAKDKERLNETPEVAPEKSGAPQELVYRGPASRVVLPDGREIDPRTLDSAQRAKLLSRFPQFRRWWT